MHAVAIRMHTLGASMDCRKELHAGIMTYVYTLAGASCVRIYSIVDLYVFV